MIWVFLPFNNAAQFIPFHHPKPKDSAPPPPSDSDSAPASGSDSAASSGGSSSGGSSAGGAGGAGADGVQKDTPASPGHHALLVAGVAVAAGVAIAASFVPKRRVETNEHPLKGSLNRRINLFSNLAKHAADPGSRPPRRVGEDGAYVNADTIV